MQHLGGSYNSAGDLRFNRLADSGNGTLPGNHNGGDGYHHQLQQSSNYPQVKSHYITLDQSLALTDIL